MPYTYDDFQSYLGPAGLTESDFSAEDLALAKSNPTAGVKLLEAKSDWKNAKTDDERAMANATANQVRSQYGGYDGGIDGANGNVSLTPDDLPGGSVPATQTSFSSQSELDPNYIATTAQQYQPAPVQQAYQYTPPVQNVQPAYQYQAPVQNVQPYMEGYTDPYQTTGTPGDYQSAPAPAPFSYDKPAPTYQSTGTYNNQYDAQQKQMLGDITNYKDFTFDAETNPQMQAYTKQYHREGNRAMQDTMGAMAGMTGGMPSTAAVSAAQQANNYYMSQLGDKLPEVYQAEFNKYLQEFNMLQDKYGAVNQAENIDYARYWDGENFNWEKYLAEQGQYNTDRGQAFNEYQSNLGQYNADRNFGYGQAVDDINYKTDANNTAYNRAATADEVTYGRGRDSVADQNYAQEQYRQQNETDYNRGVYADETGYNRNIYEDETAYNRGIDQRNYDYQTGRDAISDEQFNSEQKRLQADSDFDRKYKVAVLENDAQGTAYNQAVDRFEMMGYADAQTAEILGVPENSVWGGAATEQALAQSKLEMEETQARINNINKDTAYIGVYKPDAASKGIDEGRINTAYNNIKGGTGTGADEAILIDAGFSQAQIAALKQGGSAGDEYGDMSDTPAEEPETDMSWRSDYDEGSLAKLPNVTSEADIQKLIDSGEYYADVRNGKIYVVKRTKANH